MRKFNKFNGPKPNSLSKSIKSGGGPWDIDLINIIGHQLNLLALSHLLKLMKLSKSCGPVHLASQPCLPASWLKQPTGCNKFDEFNRFNRFKCPKSV